MSLCQDVLCSPENSEDSLGFEKKTTELHGPSEMQGCPAETYPPNSSIPQQRLKVPLLTNVEDV